LQWRLQGQAGDPDPQFGTGLPLASYASFNHRDEIDFISTLFFRLVNISLARPCKFILQYLQSEMNTHSNLFI